MQLAGQLRHFAADGMLYPHCRPVEQTSVSTPTMTLWFGRYRNSVVHCLHQKPFQCDLAAVLGAHVEFEFESVSAAVVAAAPCSLVGADAGAGAVPEARPRRDRRGLRWLVRGAQGMTPATPRTTNLSLVMVPVLSKQHTSTLPAEGMR